MAKITTHILDTARGKPAANVDVVLERFEAGVYSLVRRGVTDDDGRLKTLTDPDGVSAGTYRLTFEIASYFESLAQESFYPFAQITFVVKDPAQHFHVPLLLQAFGFTTYRGS
jgi:5-hydroxyisourate hydrolase